MALPQVQPVIKAATMARDRFVFGLDKVPDEKLSWSPGGEAKSPLQLAGSVEGFMGFLTHLLNTGTMPENRGQRPPAPETRDDAKERVTQAINGIIALVEGASEADLQKPVQVPWGGTVPAVEMMFGATNVLAYFQGQLNYLQTVYGDMDPNIPPSWLQDRDKY